MKTATIQKMVHDCYWTHDTNCAGTTLTVLSALHNLPLNTQVMQASIGMHGAGKFRAQCGLVEGTLMFLGLHGTAQGKTPEAITDDCFEFASAFTERFGSLSCKVLRPGGFTKNDAPHQCEGLTVEALTFASAFIEGLE